MIIIDLIAPITSNLIVYDALLILDINAAIVALFDTVLFCFSFVLIEDIVFVCLM